MSIPVRNTEKYWGLVSQSFHWLIVFLIIFQYTWAWRIDQAEGLRQRLALVPQHKTVGAIILVLAVLRLIWRGLNKAPAMPASMPRWEQWGAHLGHWLLYGLLFAVPLTGWAYSSAAGLGDYWWGPVNLPNLVQPGSELLENSFQRAHSILTKLLALVAVGHALAALRHHFFIRDDILRRMLPLWKKL